MIEEIKKELYKIETLNSDGSFRTMQEVFKVINNFKEQDYKSAWEELIQNNKEAVKMLGNESFKYNIDLINDMQELEQKYNLGTNKE